jgi:hypothetical protein
VRHGEGSDQAPKKKKKKERREERLLYIQKMDS